MLTAQQPVVAREQTTHNNSISSFSLGFWSLRGLSNRVFARARKKQMVSSSGTMGQIRTVSVSELGLTRNRWTLKIESTRGRTLV